nr:intercellular adhesion molecule 1 isoform X2 [Symphalangus syndactylus]
MAPSGPRPALLALLVLLGALFPVLGNAETSVSPTKVILSRGGSVRVTCSTSCDQHTLLGIETPLPKKELLPGGNNWKTYELSNVQEDSQPMCYSNCADRQSTAKTFLTVYFLPATPPQLVSPRVLEVDTQGTVVCSLDGLFPVSEAQVHLALGDQRLDPTVTYGVESLSAEASVSVTAGEEGTQQLLCAVILGNQSQETRQTVTIYSFPAPNVTLTEPEVSEGTEVIVKCEAHPRAKVTLNGVPAQPLGPTAQFLLKATPEDNGRSFSCSATLEVAGQLVHKNQTQELRVLYGPRLDERDCPGNWTWPENSQQSPVCQAWGNPLPELKCLKDGTFPLPIGESVTVTRDLEGTYLCRARSTRGEVTREVTVNVLSPRYGIVIIIVVAAAAILGTAGLTTYLYNRQRKIRKYRLQQAQKGTPMKPNTQATPP